MKSYSIRMTCFKVGRRKTSTSKLTDVSVNFLQTNCNSEFYWGASRVRIVRIGESVCGCWEQFSGSFPLYLASSFFFSFGTKKVRWAQLIFSIFFSSSSLPFLFVNIYRYIWRREGSGRDVSTCWSGSSGNRPLKYPRLFACVPSYLLITQNFFFFFSSLPYSGGCVVSPPLDRARSSLNWSAAQKCASLIFKRDRKRERKPLGPLILTTLPFRNRMQLFLGFHQEGGKKINYLRNMIMKRKEGS